MKFHNYWKYEKFPKGFDIGIEIMGIDIIRAVWIFSTLEIFFFNFSIDINFNNSKRPWE
jgi:hypothetical protein